MGIIQWFKKAGKKSKTAKKKSKPVKRKAKPAKGSGGRREAPVRRVGPAKGLRDDQPLKITGRKPAERSPTPDDVIAGWQKDKKKRRE